MALTRPATASLTVADRLTAIDLLRGIVMVLMLLDHSRDFLHDDTLRFSATDLSRTYPAMFFTRWATHFCAPIFVFLAGTSVYLQRLGGAPRPRVARLLLTRGLWLVVLELTLVRLGLTFNFDLEFLGVLQVIWAIGLSMVCLAGLVYLPTGVVAAFGVLLVGGHHLFDHVRVGPWAEGEAPTWAEGLWMVLHQPGTLPLGPTEVFVLYPLVPWVGVMAAGYAFGACYGWPAVRRQRFLRGGGLVLIGLFGLLRALNVYGDPSPWEVQDSSLFTVMSFLNTTKYPPSLLFLLMTIGPAWLLLWVFERWPPAAGARPLLVLGRVPLFFYLLQWPAARTLSLLLHALTDKEVAFLFTTPGGNGAIPPDAGFGLWVTYVGWLVGLWLLYPLCRWFYGVKQRRRDWWLRYL